MITQSMGRLKVIMTHQRSQYKDNTTVSNRKV